jgi:hypothetical protein
MYARECNDLRVAANGGGKMKYIRRGEFDPRRLMRQAQAQNRAS